MRADGRGQRGDRDVRASRGVCSRSGLSVVRSDAFARMISLMERSHGPIIGSAPALEEGEECAASSLKGELTSVSLSAEALVPFAPDGCSGQIRAFLCRRAVLLHRYGQKRECQGLLGTWRA